MLALLVVAAFLVAANALALVSEFRFGHKYVFGLLPLVKLSSEQNLPTHFSSVLWLACAILSIAIAASEKANGRGYIYWRILALISLYISIDEFVAFHEKVINALVRGPVAAARPYYVSWVLIYFVVVIGVVLTLGRFVLRLPLEIRRLVIIAGAGYVIGAIGFEQVGGLYLESHDWECGLGYRVVTAIEETLEMVFVITFVYALMLYAGKYAGGVGVRLSSRA